MEVLDYDQKYIHMHVYIYEYSHVCFWNGYFDAVMIILTLDNASSKETYIHTASIPALKLTLTQNTHIECLCSKLGLVS